MASVTAVTGEEILVSDEDFARISQHRWTVHRSHRRRQAYAEAWIDGTRTLMHRLLLGERIGASHVDHVNGNGLDNRRENLRPVTHAQNQANRQWLNQNNTSGFRGVYWHRVTGKWAANIRVNRKVKYLGLFDTPETAHAAYLAAAREAFGEYMAA